MMPSYYSVGMPVLHITGLRTGGIPTSTAASSLETVKI